MSINRIPDSQEGEEGTGHHVSRSKRRDLMHQEKRNKRLRTHPCRLVDIRDDTSDTSDITDFSDEELSDIVSETSSGSEGQKRRGHHGRQHYMADGSTNTRMSTFYG
jgi:hypothetical protein